MSVVTPLVALKAQVEVAGPGAVSHVDRVTNDIRLSSRSALQQQLGVGLLASKDSNSRSNTSPSVRSGEAVTLSVVARTVSAILDLSSGPVPKILGVEPLWPNPQRSDGGLLAAALSRAVVTSGLFYEAHLLQHVAGTRTLAQLALEPQAHLAAPVKTPGELPSANVAGQDLGPGDMAQRIAAALAMRSAESALPEVASASSDASAVERAVGIVGSRASQADAESTSKPLPVGVPGRVDSAHLAATYGVAGAREEGPAGASGLLGPEATAKTIGVDAGDGLRNSASGPLGIHPDSVLLVRQQLELLAVPVFRWGGEVWRGTPMDWEIRREPDERAALSETEVVQRTWTTRLAVLLPALKSVEVRLSLVGSALQVSLAASQNTTIDFLSDGHHDLSKRFGALGLQLTSLQIGSVAEHPAAQNGGDEGDVA